MCLADARLFLPGLNLAYTDRASMAASVEVRVPFVDPVVARAAFSLKGTDKIRRRQQGRSQGGRRELASAGDRPPAEGLVQRAACEPGSRSELREVVDDVLVGGELVDAGMIRKAAAERLVDEERAGREDRSKQIWQLLTLELWYRNAQPGRGGMTRMRAARRGLEPDQGIR